MSFPRIDIPSVGNTRQLLSLLVGIFQDLFDYPWILPLYKCDSLDDLINSFEEKVIAPAATKAKEVEERRMKLENELSP